ncbi:DUF885 domain-containing protein [Henriciella litoralis]|uniref:DUF885 domain-containing protein n=1 Tax=Henriciella litoralis TaxID=568102 RepID=UPI000A01A585|nr:DUF885 domain-containing protein [Henriciella litoralis]
MKRLGLMAAASATAILLSGCAANTTPAETSTSAAKATVEVSETWPDFMGEFLNGYFELNPSFAVVQGRHEFDGQLPDWSEAGIQAQIDYRENAIAAAQSIDPATLSEEEAFERQYFINTMKGELFWLTEADFPHSNPDFYIYTGGLDPDVYISRPYADKETRFRAFIDYLHNIPAVAEQIKANFTLPMPETYVKYGTAGFGGFADYYQGDGKAAFADVDNLELQAEFETAAAAASTAMQSLADYVGSQPGTPDGFALGPEKFSDMIRLTEGVDIPLDELEAIGRADLKANQDALAEACSVFAPGASMEDCMAKMAANKPENGPVQEARDSLAALKAFILEKDLVTIPGTEEALVEESPPYNRQNSAYISIPGPYETGMPSVYYISPPDPSWDEATRAAYIPGKMDLLGTTVHEVWPGHFLNFLHAVRSDSKFGQIFVGYAFAEGWAHYTEEMMLDAGLHDYDAETRIGQLSNALLRNCRYLSAIGLHTQGWSVDDSYELFRKECYIDKGNATQQAARGTYDPAYLNYTMGKLMIRKLRDDWVAENYPDATGTEGWKEFHDEFLSYGGPNIPQVRQAMMDEDEAHAVFGE